MSCGGERSGCAGGAGAAAAEGARPRRDSSGDNANDECELEDDFCFYRYRGDPPPREPPQPEPRDDPASGASSPDMDFLEMDFDPGPSCEMDTTEELFTDEELETPPPPAERPQPSPEPGPSTAPCKSNDLDSEIGERGESSLSNETTCEFTVNWSAFEPEREINPESSRNGGPTTPFESTRSSSGQSDEEKSSETIKPAIENGRGHFSSKLIPHVTVDGNVIYVKRTCTSWPPREIESHHSASGDLISPGEIDENDLPESFTWNSIVKISSEQRAILESRVNLSSALYHCTMAKRLVVEKHAAKFIQECDTSNVDGEISCESGEPPIVPKCMLWTEQEACAKQVTQIGTSACGATAVINALLALRRAVDVERVTSAVNTRQRLNNSPLCQYIISRAIAGCGVDGLMSGLHAGSEGAVSSRHFAMWPERKISLSHWLSYWISLGAVPIATLNLQAGIPNPSRKPDSWHHQMIFGVGPRGIYLANPVECIEEGALWHQLCSDSILYVKRKDVLNRWTRLTDLSPLKVVPGDVRWQTMNVYGQVVNIIRESQQNTIGLTFTTHIKIPACYSAGITIAVLTGSEAHKRLSEAPELPLLDSEE